MKCCTVCMRVESTRILEVSKETVSTSRHYAAYNEILMIMSRKNVQWMGGGLLQYTVLEGGKNNGPLNIITIATKNWTGDISIKGT